MGQQTVGVKKKKGWFWHPVVTIALMVVAVLALGASARLYKGFQAAQDVRDRERGRVEKLEQEYEQILARLDKIQTPEGFEREVKDRYRVARAGEELVVILDEEESAPALDTEPEASLTWWQWLVSLWKKSS